jgi:hypothetical protein
MCFYDIDNLAEGYPEGGGGAERVTRPIKKSSLKLDSSVGEIISSSGHEDMRSGLQSIMSTLDDMLAGMKKK